MAPAVPYWCRPAVEALVALSSSPGGLSSRSARERLRRLGPNRVAEDYEVPAVRLFIRQFESPLVLIVVFGAAIWVRLRSQSIDSIFDLR